jgi:hypothetical protein
MVSIVNGYVCFSSCDVAAAKQGKDPNAPPGALPGEDADKTKPSALDRQPATVLDGALKDLRNAVDPAAAPGGAGGPQPRVDLRA